MEIMVNYYQWYFKWLYERMSAKYLSFPGASQIKFFFFYCSFFQAGLLFFLLFYFYFIIIIIIAVSIFIIVFVIF